MDSKPSDLFQSIIYTPVEYPECFAGNGPIKRTLEKNGLDPYTTGNAIGRFLCDFSVTHLYVAGYVNTHADLFFRDLKRVLSVEPEITFCENSDYLDETRGSKVIVRHFSLNRNYVTPTNEHVVLEFRKKANSNYYAFNREQFAAFVYCANTEDGPNPVYKCRSDSGVLCVRRRYTGIRTCGVCFWIDEKPKLKTVRSLVFRGVLEEDEGSVCYPLHIHPSVFTEQFGETDTEPIPESDSEYDSEADF